AISFKRDTDTFTQNKLQVNENAAGFAVFRDTAPLFGWFANVTISGNAGDPFANFEAGPHQVVRAFRGEFTWGSGASRAKRGLTCRFATRWPPATPGITSRSRRRSPPTAIRSSSASTTARAPASSRGSALSPARAAPRGRSRSPPPSSLTSARATRPRELEP